MPSTILLVLFNIAIPYVFPTGSSQLEAASGATLSLERSVDDIFSESVSISSGQARATLVQLDIVASDGVIHSIDTVI